MTLCTPQRVRATFTHLEVQLLPRVHRRRLGCIGRHQRCLQAHTHARTGVGGAASRRVAMLQAGRHDLPSRQRQHTTCGLTIAAATSGALTALKRARQTVCAPGGARRMPGSTLSMTCLVDGGGSECRRQGAAGAEHGSRGGGRSISLAERASTGADTHARALPACNRIGRDSTAAAAAGARLEADVLSLAVAVQPA